MNVNNTSVQTGFTVLSDTFYNSGTTLVENVTNYGNIRNVNNLSIFVRNTKNGSGAKVFRELVNTGNLTNISNGAVFKWAGTDAGDSAACLFENCANYGNISTSSNVCVYHFLSYTNSTSVEYKSCLTQ